MGAAALAGRLPRRHARRIPAAEPEATLAFGSAGGPVVAVCGLAGGAGASTLAYLLARRAARHSTAPVLLAELHEHAALAALAGTAGPVGLRELALAVEQEREPARPFAELPGGLRLVASSSPTLGDPKSAPALPQLLADAQQVHGLVVVDAGRLQGPDDRAVIDTASHILFVLPATVAALGPAELLAAAGILEQTAGAVAALVAVATVPGRRPLKRLRRLAERHVDRLLLVPHIAELAAGQHDQAEMRLEDTFACLATLLRRPR
jgi:Mrp family chromosome partitioning ATPase